MGTSIPKRHAAHHICPGLNHPSLTSYFYIKLKMALAMGAFTFKLKLKVNV